jgi:hypothetical protein
VPRSSARFVEAHSHGGTIVKCVLGRSQCWATSRGYQPRPSSYSRQADCQPAHHRAARLDLNRPRRVESAFLEDADGVEHASGGNPWLATSHRDSPLVRQAMTQPLPPYCARST